MPASATSGSRESSDIAGATGPTYELTAAEEGKTIMRPGVLHRRRGLPGDALTSAATAEVEAEPGPQEPPARTYGTDRNRRPRRRFLDLGRPGGCHHHGVPGSCAATRL